MPGDVVPRTFLFDVVSNTWVEQPYLNSARRYHSSSAFKDTVYVYGGLQTRKFCTSIEKLTIK